MNGRHLRHHVPYPRYYPFTSDVCYPWSNLFGTVGNTVGISILYVHVMCCVVLCCVCDYRHCLLQSSANI